MSKKIESLRNLMKQKGYDFYIVPSTDDHKNEYLPECWEFRAWISGFTGSAGDVLIGLDNAYLSTDGRYFLQAEEELDKNLFTLIKQKGSQSEILDFLKAYAKDKTVAVDPKKLDINTAENLINIMNSIGGKVIFDNENLIEIVQKELNENIELPNSKVFVHDIQYSGQSVKSKINSIRQTLKDKNQQCLIETKLDSIAWTLNIRARDIKCTPVCVSYLAITLDKIYWYVDSQKLNKEVLNHLSQINIEIKPYENFYNDLENYSSNYMVDKANANYCVKSTIEKNKNSKIFFENSPITLSKALKNTIEISGAKEAHKKDAVAFIKWWYWLENNFDNQDEITASKKLLEFRQEQKDFIEDSFDSISGYASNGAIIHYKATEKSAKKLGNEKPYLIDSGGQYLQGTTDVTRVLHFGNTTHEQRRFYTLVLKGHLSLGRSSFPKGTTGSQLDPIARQFLWRFNADYLHGTGHGVGNCLGVHEGPQGITPISKQELMLGMVLSNEPGVYFENNFGIRIENLCFIKKSIKENFIDKEFYCFENLTLIPYESKLMEMQMLTYTEKKVINKYNTRIRKEILPLIEDENIKKFLLSKTRYIR